MLRIVFSLPTYLILKDTFFGIDINVPHKKKTTTINYLVYLHHIKERRKTLQLEIWQIKPLLLAVFFIFVA